MLKKFLATLALILPITLGATACATEPVELSADTVIIDVRTPDEFAGGHLEGALNIDVQSGDFAAEISQLDPAGDYFVYCRSGNRSGQAISQMSNMGFSSMTNGGSVANASSISGVPVVID
jgi:rhodanese-related sulfurtransferase